MLNRIKHWLKWKLAGEELTELHYLKQDIEHLKVWCSHIPVATASAQWLLDNKKYPYQLSGAYGSIEDFRVYLEKI